MAPDIDPSELSSSGVIKKGEDIIDYAIGSMVDSPKGLLVITNKRYLYVKRPGIFSKGLNLVFYCSLGEILSVATRGLVSKKIEITCDINGKKRVKSFLCKNAELFSNKIVAAKEGYTESKIIDAKRVIIEEGNKDKADEILKKKLARGEIDLEEFHRKIQRT
ncbi:MAG: PH domain-containing protein [Candidatus Omnitrophica bacterium]|nr:PH domain-containing protein [Candidatus Omnitrophota bacterium]